MSGKTKASEAGSSRNYLIYVFCFGPAVAFLTTWVSMPDKDDWKKLGRVIM
jgi:hypothetical protein